ncbi:MAG: saccharopine dehydrogenase NADP-binding domain-containing protein [bacterium]|nr:saccharopine dehydrogenase NADP-binding domain-containing protein [bacterium]
MTKPEIVILGAGLMGRVAAYFFANHPDGPFPVRLADKDETVLRQAADWLRSDQVESMTADAGSEIEVGRALAGMKVCLSCVPYFLNPKVARAALRSRVSMVDLGGNPQVTDVILSLDDDARRKGIVFVPDTGLAPGLVNVLAWDLVHRFQKCDEVHIRVGGLPQKPEGPLKYSQVFSIHGLLNEYLEKAREIRGGKAVDVPSPSDVEELVFDELGIYEAFVTSGGTSTLPKTLLGKVSRLDYKTIRYPGHYAALRLLVDLGLASVKAIRVEGAEIAPRDFLARVLEGTLPKNVPDIVLVQVRATGDGGREEKIELAARQDENRGLSAMGQMTAFPAAAIALAILVGNVPPGAHPQETVISSGWMKEQLGKFGIDL